MQILMKASLALAALVLAACANMAGSSPQLAVDGLLAADRSFSAASAKTDLVAGLSAMFDADVVMPLPTGTFAHGKAEATAALRVNPENPTSHAEWTPVRGGISADGQQGFTFGWMTTKRASGQALPGKYLAYWVKRPEGWRVRAYKRAAREAGDVSDATMAPSLPASLAPVVTDTGRLNRQRQSLKDAEKSFSDLAQTIGLGPAFAKTGAADAMNLGGGRNFTLGAAAISAEVSAGRTGKTTINWSSEDVEVASSGDLGVSWGFIRPNSGEGKASPFFTIWRRDGPAAPWRYIAE